MEDTAKKRTYAELLSLTETQREQVERYEKRLRDVVAAYKALQKEKAALDEVVRALSSSAEQKKAEQDEEDAAQADEATDKSKSEQANAEQGGGESHQENGSSAEQVSEHNAEKAEAGSKPESVSKLREKIAALSNALATVTGEKNRLEQAYVAEKKLIRHEFDDKINSLQRVIVEHEDENTALRQENGELKNKLRSAAHDYETMQLKANREIQELHATSQRGRREISEYETRLADSSAANDRLKQRTSEVETQLRTVESQLRNVTLELERTRVANEREESRRKESESQAERIRELESAVSSLQERTQRDTSSASDLRTRLERELSEVRRTYEERLRAFETHVAELSATVGRYETVRRDDATAIEQLRARCAALASEKADLLAMLDSTNSAVGSRAASDAWRRRRDRNTSGAFERSASVCETESNTPPESPIVSWLTNSAMRLERTAVNRGDAICESIKSHVANTISSIDVHAFADSDEFDTLVEGVFKSFPTSEEDSDAAEDDELVRRFLRAVGCAMLLEYAALSATRFTELVERARTAPCSLHSLVHVACIEHSERMRDEFEKYRLRAQAALRSSGSLIVLGNGSSSGTGTTVVTSRLGSSSQSGASGGAGLSAALVNELHAKLTTERDRHAQLEAELANMREFTTKTTQLLKEQHANELRTAEAKHRSTVQTIESELQKTRSRTVQLLTEKDDEISILQKRLDHALSFASSNRYIGTGSNTFASNASGFSIPFGTASEPASLGGAMTDRSSPSSPEAASCIDEPGTTSTSASFGGLLVSRANASATVNMIVVNEQHARLENELIETKRGRVALEKELKRVALEHRNESQRNRELISELQERIAHLERERNLQGGSGGAAAAQESSTQYLKNVVYRYLLTDDSNTKKQIANALCMILRFNKQERRTIEHFLREGRLPAGSS